MSPRVLLHICALFTVAHGARLAISPTRRAADSDDASSSSSSSSSLVWSESSSSSSSSLAWSESSGNEEAPAYGTSRFWDEHYTKDHEPYDWLLDYQELRGFIENATAGDLAARVLHVGCGNSLLPEAMYDDGYQDITSIDTSPVVIEQMAARTWGRAGLGWLVMDATKISFPSGTFDAVMDKSMVDTFGCRLDARRMTLRYLREVARLLRPGGTFLSVSFTKPADLAPLLMRHFDPGQYSVSELKPHDARGPTNYVYIVRTRLSGSGPGGLRPASGEAF